MKLEKAIEILEKEEEDTFMGSEKVWKKAVSLGYAALRRIVDMRKSPCITADEILPGETE